MTIINRDVHKKHFLLWGPELQSLCGLSGKGYSLACTNMLGDVDCLECRRLLDLMLAARSK